MPGKKNSVFIILGQSNAVGHGIPMKASDVITKPLKNVFGLHRDNNQSFVNHALKWSNYTSSGMNLAEEQDNTYSISNCLAAVWQEHINQGNKYDLPDLYIIQIAIGSQGVTEGFMWNPEMQKKLIPGRLGTVDISLFPFCKHIFSMLKDSFISLGKEYEIIGLHWRGGESDIYKTEEYLKVNLEGIYREIFEEFSEILEIPPIVLHKIVCADWMNENDSSGNYFKRMECINDVFEKLTQRYLNISVFDPRSTPQYISGIRGNGLFENDMIHFTPEVNKEIAKKIFRDYVNA